MYRIVNVTARDEKTVKPQRIGRLVYDVDKITDIMSGVSYCYCEYADKEHEGQALYTSPEVVRHITPDGKTITVVTNNSVYTFEKVEK